QSAGKWRWRDYRIMWDAILLAGPVAGHDGSLWFVVPDLLEPLIVDPLSEEFRIDHRIECQCIDTYPLVAYLAASRSN
ncbi:MAG: hypothetical protein P8Y60_17630, partial [Calditrichota bacterium]